MELPRMLPAGTGKPTSNCRRVTGTQGGGIGPASQKCCLRGALGIQYFYIGAGIRDRDHDRKASEVFQRHGAIRDAHVYEFDLQRSSGEA
jgi:hypothetical protein